MGSTSENCLDATNAFEYKWSCKMQINQCNAVENNITSSFSTSTLLL